MSDYQPEIGQAVFGQPWQRERPDTTTKGALEALRSIYDATYTSEDGFDGPFSNSGARVKSSRMEIHAYSWNDEEDHKWNLKWRDFECSWYKHFGLGLSVNRQLSPEEVPQIISDLLLEKPQEV